MEHFDSYSNKTYSGLTLQVRKSYGSFNPQQTTQNWFVKKKIPSTPDSRYIPLNLHYTNSS